MWWEAVRVVEERKMGKHDYIDKPIIKINERERESLIGIKHVTFFKASSRKPLAN